MLNVIYEDNHLLVVIKPQNIPCQEDETKDLDLLNMCKQYIKEKYSRVFTNQKWCAKIHTYTL